MITIFISHAHVDGPAARVIGAALRSAGHPVFLSEDIPGGATWLTELLAALRRADVVMALVTKAFNDSTWCGAELGVALDRGRRLVPVQLEDGVTNPVLTDRQYVAMPDGPVPEAVADLVASFRPQHGAANPLHPHTVYPGARAFGPDDRWCFFGRVADTDRLGRQVTDAVPGMHTVVGPSGCGKTSLLMAGLVPWLERDARWRTVVVRTRGHDAETALARALADELGPQWTDRGVAASFSQPAELEALVDDLLRTPTPAGHPRPERLVVVIDGLDQLVDLTPGRQHRLIEVLRRLAEWATIVTSLRWTTYDALQRPTGPVLASQLFQLGHLGREALREVIEEPAGLAGFRIDPHLVSQLIDDTGDGRALALLAVTLATLTADAAAGVEVTSAWYGRTGSFTDTVVAAANGAVTALGLPEDRVTDALSDFVNPDGIVPPRRVDDGSVPDRDRAVIAEFVNRRLLAVDRGESGRLFVEVTHPDLLTSWRAHDRSEAWADRIQVRHSADRAARDWDTGGRRRQLIWRGWPLARARQLLRWDRSDDRERLGQTTVEFLRTSWRWDRSLHYGVIIALALLTVVSVVGAVVSLRVRDDAIAQAERARAQQRLAVSRQLLAEATAIRDTDPRGAARLSLAAAGIEPGAETRASLLRDAVDSPIIASLVETAPLRATAYSPDGRRIADAPERKPLVLWDLTVAGHPRRWATIPPPVDDDPVLTIAFSPDGRLLAVGDTSGAVFLWDVTTQRPQTVGAPVRLGSGDVAIGVKSVRFSPDGRTLAVGDEAGGVSLWDVTSARHARLGAPVRSAGPAVDVVAFSPDGHFLAAGDDDGVVTQWDLTRPGRPVRGQPVPAADAAIYTVAFSPDGRLLASGGEDNQIRLWDARSARHPQIGNVLTLLTTPVTSVAFSPDGTLLGAGSDEGVAALWDVRIPARPRASTRLVAHDRSISTIAFSPTGTELVTASEDGTAILWDLRRLPYPRFADPLTGHTDGVLATAFRPDGAVLATGGEDRTVQLWSTTATPYTRLGPALTNHDETVYAITFSPDGATMVSADDNGVVLLWDVRSPARPRVKGTVSADGGAVYGVAVSPDGTTLATGSDDGVVRLYDLTRTGYPEVEGSQISLSATITSVAFSPDGTRLAAGSVDNTLAVWDLTESAHREIGPPITAHDNTVWSVAFSPDGRLLASASTDRTVRLFDAVRPDHPQVGRTLADHTGPVQALAFSRDGRILAAGGADGDVILWDLTETDHPELGPPMPLAEVTVWSVAFSPDNRFLAVGTDVGQTALVDLTALARDRDDLVARACAIAGREITSSEWRAYGMGIAQPQVCPA